MNAIYKFFTTPIPSNMTVLQTLEIFSAMVLAWVFVIALLTRYDEQFDAFCDWFIHVVRKGKE
jgi:hypothetical protein